MAITLVKDALRRVQTKRYSRLIGQDSLNAALHLEYAHAAARLGRRYLAYAELKTAMFLDEDPKLLDLRRAAYRKALPDPRQMSHNQFFRFKSLASEIMGRYGDDLVSVLDVGGGEGGLASFLPDNAVYCLAEPGVNGISGINLPFDDHAFDFVVSCHVLEHIPENERSLFLDQLLSKSKKGLILLNPFHIEGTHVDKRLEFVVEVTNYKWAQEHLECRLPRIEDVQNYASERGLDICIKPNGTMTASAIFVFLDYFASKSRRSNEWKKVNAFFNEHYCDILDSESYPNAYLVYLSRKSTQAG